MKMDTARLVVFGHFISVLILSFGLECVTSSRDLALNKTATQSSTYRDGQTAYDAGRAVDGTLGRKATDGHCSHTGLNQSQAWWKVDLGQMYRIQTINITYRQAFTYRLSGYYLYVTNDTHVTQSPGRMNSSLGNLCYQDSGPGYPSYNQSRSCPITGRSVIIYNKRPADYVPTYRYGYSHTEALIELCEVQVFGCPVNHFGPDCSSECHCSDSGCNPDTGQCDVSGCRSGWMGTSCSEIRCEPGRFGAHCDFTCHCNGHACNSSTGICDETVCEAGWKGPSCYTAANDLALRKPTSQSSVNEVSRSDSSNANDGFPGKENCSRTYPRGWTHAWWKVDLEDTYRINTINLVFTQTHKSIIRGYYLYVSNVSNTDSFSQAYLCFHDKTTSTNTSPSYIMSHPCSVDGQYVIVYNNRTDYDTFHQAKHHMKYASTEAVVELCDVQVLGCPLNRFAANCNKTCHCKNEGCHSDTGVCDVPGCQERWTAENCSVCANNRYGSECNQECHCLKEGCDMVTGRCTQPGCQKGWKGDACDRMCDTNQFGPDCTKQCHCKIVGCNRIDGTCNVTGCQDGWMGEACDQICVNNRYGSECTQECHCLTEGCDMVTGRCTKPGCQSGWKGDACDRMCDTNHFGPECTKQCHCKTEGCNRIDGTCNVTGCQAGWMGKSCDQMCDTNHFGPDCTSQCHCKTEGCIRINGTCNVTGCQAGWIGGSCDQECSSGHFGPHCSEVCHCQQEGCDHANGRCHLVGCQAGWSGQACDHQCDGNTFGRDCRETCHCASSGCDRVSGMCTISGCTEGWTGDTCSQVCVAGRFGKDCLQECHCQVEGCNYIDGMCNVTGCVDGWRGKSCDHTCDFTHYGPNCLHECHCNVSACSNTNGICQTPGCEVGWTGPSCSDAKEQNSSKLDYPHIAEVSTCATGYALLGTFLAISISFNIGFTIKCTRMRFSNSRTQPPSKELQTYHIPNHENSYEGLDSTKINKTRNIYDTIVQ